MEEGQRDTIDRNLSALIENTECNVSVLAKLKENKIFSEEDADNIRGIQETHKQVERLYQVLKTRQGAFDVFIRILKETRLSGALEILQGQPQTPSCLTESQFCHEKNPVLEAFFSSNLIISTLDCQLTQKKIEQIAQQKGVYLSVSESPCIGDGETQRVTTMEVRPSKERKIRIVPADYLKPLENELQKGNESYEIYEDLFSWLNLSEAVQHKLLLRNVKFQGIEMPLKQLCENYKKSTKNLLKKLDGKLLVKLINYDEPPVISNGNVPPVPNNYVPRKLKARSHISRRILNITKDKSEKDILLFVGLELYELTGLVEKYGNGECKRSSDISNQEGITCQSILLEASNADEDMEFYRICQMTRLPVHLFTCKKAKDNKNEVTALEWKKSKGSFETLYKFMHAQQQCYNEEEFLDFKSMKSFCIAELPGNGKTTLIAKCAQILINQKRPDFYTQYVVISEFIKHLIGEEAIIDKDNFPVKYVLSENEETKKGSINRNQVEIPCSRIFKVLSDTSCQSPFGRAYVKSFVKTYGFNCDYMFDGFDELPSNQLELALSVIEYLRRAKRKYIRVWVTTRPDLLESLEESLGVLGHTIDPFSEKDQIKILTTYWCNEQKAPEENEKLQHFAQQCLQALKTDRSDGENDIAGIPLLCLLVAEVYQEDALANSSENQDSTQLTEFKISTTKLYEKFIDKRFKNSKVPKVYLENAHIELAIQLLLPSAAKDINATILQGTKSVSRKELLSLGIVQTEIGNLTATPRFIHKTIAEYFVANALHNLFQKIVSSHTDSEDKSEELIPPFILLCRHVLHVQGSSIALSSNSIDSCQEKSFRFSHPNICHFLNLIIENPLPVKSIKSILFTYDKEMDNPDLVKKNLWRCLHAAVVDNFNEIAIWEMCCLTLLHPKPNQKKNFCQEVFNESSFKCLLFFAAKYGSRSLMRNVRSFFEEWTQEKAIKQELKETHFPLQEGRVRTLLHVAVEAGNYPVAKCLLKERGYDTQIDDEKYKNLLHSCLLKSNHDNEAVISNKIKIINLLMGESNASYKQRDSISESILSLMIEPVNLKLLFCLLNHMKEHRLPISSFKNSEGKNLLHLLPTKHYDENMNPDKYHEHLEIIENLFNLEELLTSKDKHNLTPVDWAVSSLDLLDKTLNIFSDYIKGNDTIVKAIAGQRSADFLRRLIFQGAKWEGAFSSKTVLHFAAEKYNYEATQLFTSSKYYVDVNAQNDDGNTPLHICLRKAVHKRARSLGGQENIANVESPDSNSSLTNINIISGEVEPSNQHRIVAHLIQKGAKILQPNNQRETPLHFAIAICKGLNKVDFTNLKKQKTFDTCSLTLAYIGIILNEKIGSVWHPDLVNTFADELRKLKACADEFNEQGSPLLHLAGKKHSMGVQYLLENGLADATLKNKAGKIAREFMGCTADCQIYNCRKIKSLLHSYELKNKPDSAV